MLHTDAANKQKQKNLLEIKFVFDKYEKRDDNNEGNNLQILNFSLNAFGKKKYVLVNISIHRSYLLYQVFFLLFSFGYSSLLRFVDDPKIYSRSKN